MDETKKKLVAIAIAVIAVIALGVSFSKNMTEQKGKAVGSLEEGVNKENGLPLNPPPNPGGAGPSNDPSLPK